MLLFRFSVREEAKKSVKNNFLFYSLHKKNPELCVFFYGTIVLCLHIIWAHTDVCAPNGEYLRECKIVLTIVYAQQNFFFRCLVPQVRISIETKWWINNKIGYHKLYTRTSNLIRQNEWKGENENEAEAKANDRKVFIRQKSIYHRCSLKFDSRIVSCLYIHAEWKVSNCAFDANSLCEQERFRVFVCIVYVYAPLEIV